MVKSAWPISITPSPAGSAFTVAKFSARQAQARASLLPETLALVASCDHRSAGREEVGVRSVDAVPCIDVPSADHLSAKQIIGLPHCREDRFGNISFAFEKAASFTCTDGL
jgi:hypothetical protein